MSRVLWNVAETLYMTAIVLRQAARVWMISARNIWTWKQRPPRVNIIDPKHKDKTMKWKGRKI